MKKGEILYVLSIGDILRYQWVPFLEDFLGSDSLNLRLYSCKPSMCGGGVHKSN